MHLEFVVLGPPISNQQSTRKRKTNLKAWRAAVAGAAKPLWLSPLLTSKLKAIVINFHSGSKPSVDVDNMSKPIFDVLQKIVYENDRQIVQAEITHTELGGRYAIAGVSKILVNALQANQQFTYVRLEDPVIPFSLPK